ncbi:MAG: nucleotidyltransferase family protein [Gemmatimonadota bacterium]|nr:nucleotidyltransferase family protein [Gemmatimonadota bacterium]
MQSVGWLAVITTFISPLPVDVWGVVPCSGRSSRMGTPKAMLDAGGRTFLECVIISLRRGGCRRVLVSLPSTKGPVAAKARGAGAIVVENPCPEEGPIGSLRAALRVVRLDVEGVAFCPVDHPLIQVETVRALVTEFTDNDGPLVVPTFRGKRGHPVLFRRNLFDELLNTELPEGARTVVHNHLHAIAEVPVEDNGIVTDIDDLSDYRRHFPRQYRLRFQSR